MNGYGTLGSKGLAMARSFYSALLGTIGAKELMRLDHGFTLYGTSLGKPAVALVKPYDGKTATVGNGVMVALAVDGRDKVDALHAKALALGGTCEGKPGVRGDEGPQAFYGAYFRDLDGNKLCAFRIGPK